MYLECNECGKLLNLPDDKLPVGKPFSFVCPYCKEKNTAHIETIPDDIPDEPLTDGNYPLGRRSLSPPPDMTHYPQDASNIAADQTRLPQQQAPLQSAAPQQQDTQQSAAPQQQAPLQSAAPQQQDTQQSAAPQQQAPLQPAAPQQQDTQQSASLQSAPPPKVQNSYALPQSDDLEAEIQQYSQQDSEDRPKALIVYDDVETSEKLIERLGLMGLESVLAVNVRDAAKQIKINKFEVMILQENYYGATLQGNQLLRAVQSLDSHKRHGMLIILISPTITTLDDFRAFTLSIDAIINSKDLISMLERTLLSTKGRAKKFYSPYFSILSELGFEH